MAKPWEHTDYSTSQPIIPANAPISPAFQLNESNPSPKSQPKAWEPPIRFTRVPGLQPPAFPLLEEERLINEVTPLVIRKRNEQAAEDSEDETQIMESYPPVSFAGKEAHVVPIIHREVPLPPASQIFTPIVTELKKDFPRFRVPPLLTICQKCEVSQASDQLYTDQPCSQPCLICKRCLYQTILTGNPHCPMCSRQLAAWEQDLIKAYGESLQS
jgi:hypothetical protein